MKILEGREEVIRVLTQHGAIYKGDNFYSSIQFTVLIKFTFIFQALYFTEELL